MSSALTFRNSRECIVARSSISTTTNSVIGRLLNILKGHISKKIHLQRIRELTPQSVTPLPICDSNHRCGEKLTRTI